MNLIKTHLNKFFTFRTCWAIIAGVGELIPFLFYRFLLNLCLLMGHDYPQGCQRGSRRK